MTTQPASDPRMNATSAAAMAALVAQLRGPPKSRTTAVLLAVFLGWMGAHKFYMGQVGWGLLYLIFSPTLIPMLIGWIEAAVYLTQDDYEFGRRYG